jgi:hypothetical protein
MDVNEEIQDLNIGQTPNKTFDDRQVLAESVDLKPGLKGFKNRKTLFGIMEEEKSLK